MRSRPSSPYIVISIIAINIAVFFMWKSQSRGYPTFMLENFLVSWQALVQGKPWTLLTSVFSHNALFHIFINMFVLWNFGPLMEFKLGHSKFLTFYLFAGLIGSLSHSVTSAFVLHQPGLPALGASGAVAGLILVFSLLYPKEKILLLGIIPLPAIWGAFAFVALDLWGLMAQSQGGGLPIGHGAHLGGAFAGALFYILFLRPQARRLH